MRCQRCEQVEGSVQVRLQQPDLQIVELVLCPMCVMIEAHSNVGFHPESAEEGGAADGPLLA